jgi:hypothetical protein
VKCRHTESWVSQSVSYLCIVLPATLYKQLTNPPFELALPTVVFKAYAKYPPSRSSTALQLYAQLSKDSQPRTPRSHSFVTLPSPIRHFAAQNRSDYSDTLLIDI